MRAFWRQAPEERHIYSNRGQYSPKLRQERHKEWFDAAPDGAWTVYRGISIDMALPGELASPAVRQR